MASIFLYPHRCDWSPEDRRSIKKILLQYYRVSQKVRTYFNRLQFKNWITYGSFFLIIKVSIKCHFFNNVGKTVNLNFDGLPGVNSLCSIHFNKDAKKNFHQIYLRTVKLPYLTKNSILSNFDLHIRPCKSDIF